jgi:hypothetical protein
MKGVFMPKKTIETRRDFIRKAGKALGVVAVAAPLAAVIKQPKPATKKIAKQKKETSAVSCSCNGKNKNNGRCTGKGSKAASCSCGGICVGKKQQINKKKT